MIKGLFYKEWIKTKWLIIAGLILVVSGMFVWYQLIKNDYAQQQAVMFTYTIAVKHRLFHDVLRFLPSILALALALFQFVPEVSRNRYRLTLMLPVPINKLLLWMTAYGVITLTVFYLFTGLLFFAVSLQFLSAFMVWNTASNLFTWYLGGYVLYFWLTGVLFEPKWKYRVFLALLASVMLYVALSGTKTGTTVCINYALIAVCLGSICIPFYTLYRLRKGKA